MKALLLTLLLATVLIVAFADYSHYYEDFEDFDDDAQIEASWDQRNSPGYVYDTDPDREAKLASMC